MKLCDFGLLNDKPVINVQRKGAEAHHFVLDASTIPPFIAGEVVRCTVDWHRRHDNMQQHSGLMRNFFEQLTIQSNTKKYLFIIRSTFVIGHS